MPGHFRTLKERLPDADLLPASALFRHVRAVKTGEEIARLARVAEIAERSIEAALAIARAGATELDLARAFHPLTVQDDATQVLCCFCLSEERRVGTECVRTCMSPM